jgi:hypothetical protein
MTARWSGVVRGSAAPRASALQKAISMSNVGGFSHGARRAVFRGDVSTWVLVARNVGCRNGFEASWRCDQGLAARPNEAQSRATEKASDPERGPWSLSAAEGCSGQAKVERPAQAPRGWVGQNKLVRLRVQIEFVEGAWGPELS